MRGPRAGRCKIFRLSGFLLAEPISLPPPMQRPALQKPDQKGDRRKAPDLAKTRSFGHPILETGGDFGLSPMGFRTSVTT
jgi:hypothetical protein